jgi:Protein of unknown function (DUF1488)
MIVALQFPNPSGSYDATRHCVCFWGYGNSREITFQVDDAILRNLQPDAGCDERSMLSAFDQLREKLFEIARKQYVEGPQNRYKIF